MVAFPIAFYSVYSVVPAKAGTHRAVGTLPNTSLRCRPYASGPTRRYGEPATSRSPNHLRVAPWVPAFARPWSDDEMGTGNPGPGLIPSRHRAGRRDAGGQA